MCTSIVRGDNIDVLEIDAASRTKVEDTRDLLDNVPYAPVHARYKIYIIDEVHMLSNHSFNALLKTLEEPPEHVKFILATTDPQKLPITVLSRCLQFQLRSLSSEQISAHLAQVLTQEQIPFAPEALPVVAQCANGSMRDALSLLEQVVAFSDRNVTLLATQEILGTAIQTQTLELLGHIIAGRAEAALQTVHELAASNADFNNVLKMLQTFIHQVALAQVVPSALEHNLQRERLQEFAGQVAAVDLQLYYQAALMAVRDLPYAPDLVLGFEMLVLRMLAFRPVEILAESTSNIEPAAVAPIMLKTQPALKPNVAPAPPPVAQQQPIAAVANKTRDWGQVIQKLNLSGLAKVLAENCVVTLWQDDLITLTLNQNQKALLNPKNAEKIQVALQEYLGNKLKVTINVGTLETESPAEEGQRLRQAASNAAEQSIRSDQHIQQLEQIFAAKIADIQVKEQE